MTIQGLIDDLNTFTYDAYIKLIAYLKRCYIITSFSEAKEFSKLHPVVILRHDIDGSVKKALEMAEIENRLGVKATYFVLFSHKLYNVFENETFLYLWRILNLGHEIGLHYDLDVYDNYVCEGKSEITFLKMQIKALETLFGCKVKFISCHNVSVVKGKDIVMPSRGGIVNVFDMVRFGLYVSDSCKKWERTYLEALLSCDYNKVQLLTHPMLWTKEKLDREETMNELFADVSYDNGRFKKEWLDLWYSNPKLKGEKL